MQKIKEEKIQEIQKEKLKIAVIPKIATDILVLNTAVSSITAEVSSLVNKVTEMKSVLTESKDDTEIIREEIAFLRGEPNESIDQLHELQKEVSSIKAVLTSIGNEVSTIKAMLGQLISTIVPQKQ